MHCSFDFGCLATVFWKWAVSEAGWQFLWQSLKDLAAIIGVVLTALKWWESREAYIFGKLSDVLGEQSTQTRDAVRYVVQRVRRPGPADPPRAPVFAEQALRRLFNRYHWKPVFSFAGPFTSADRKLRRLHRKLDKRQRAATGYMTFVNEQRFAAHLLQGAIALGRSERTKNDNQLSRLNEAAANSLQRALTVAGKQNDLEALELKGILLRKLGQINFESDAGAPRVFEELRAAAQTQLAALDDNMPEQRLELIFVIARAVRYLAEMHHAKNANGLGRDLLDRIAPILDTKERLSPQQLLDRARFFEVDLCVRMALYDAADGEKTRQRISAATRDYKSLQDDCDPSSWDWPTRIWRACARVFREDGAKELLREAKGGLDRMAHIKQGYGCPICKPPGDSTKLGDHQIDIARTATPDQ